MSQITLQSFRDWVANQPDDTTFITNRSDSCPLAKYLAALQPNFRYEVNPYHCSPEIEVRCYSSDNDYYFVSVDPVFICIIHGIDSLPFTSPDLRINKPQDPAIYISKDSVLTVIDSYL